MMNKDQWKPSDGIVLEANAKEAIITNDNILVQAGPGAGKTELLAQKASYLFQTGSCPAPFNILAISFKRDAAENIKERVSKRNLGVPRDLRRLKKRGYSRLGGREPS